MTHQQVEDITSYQMTYKNIGLHILLMNEDITSYQMTYKNMKLYIPLMNEDITSYQMTYKNIGLHILLMNEDITRASYTLVITFLGIEVVLSIYIDHLFFRDV